MPETLAPCTSYEFAAIARALGNAARALDLAPSVSFRSPPRTGLRTITRRPGGRAIVAVALRGRSLEDVAVDMLAGVYAAHHVRATTPAGRELAAAAAEVLRGLR